LIRVGGPPSVKSPVAAADAPFLLSEAEQLDLAPRLTEALLLLRSAVGRSLEAAMLLERTAPSGMFGSTCALTVRVMEEPGARVGTATRMPPSGAAQGTPEDVVQFNSMSPGDRLLDTTTFVAVVSPAFEIWLTKVRLEPATVSAGRSRKLAGRSAPVCR